MPSYESWYVDVSALCIEAANRALEGFAKRPAIIEKGHGDWASALDLEIEQYIISGLISIAPGTRIIGEESTADLTAQLRGLPAGTLCWHVDPIDGSANFVRGIPHFASVISLSEVHGDGTSTTVMGITADPCRKECFSSMLGEPTLLNGKEQRVSPNTQAMKSLLATVTPKPDAPYLNQYGESLTFNMSRFGGIRRSGAMALDLAWVSCGRLDAFMGVNLAPWDIRAGLLQIAQAGGVFKEQEQHWQDDSGKEIDVTVCIAANTDIILNQIALNN